MTKNLKYGCILHDSSYGASLIGMGSTLEDAFSDLQEQFELLSTGEKPDAEDCIYIEYNTICTEAETVVRIKRC